MLLIPLGYQPMKRILSIFTQRPTVFLILGIAYILFAGPIGLFELNQEGERSLEGLMVLTGVLFAVILLTVDRIMAFMVPGKILNIIEVILLVAAIFYYQYQDRKVFIELADRAAYFIVIPGDKELPITDLNYAFPFNRKMIPPGNVAIFPADSPYLRRIEFRTPTHWKQGYEMTLRRVNDLPIQFYAPYPMPFNDAQIDSMIQTELRQLTAGKN